MEVAHTDTKDSAPFKEVDPFQDGGGGVHGDPDNVTDPTEVAQTV